MQIFKKLLSLKKVYIFFSSFVLFIIIFSTSYLHANTFKVTNIKISSPFELNFEKKAVIDEGFKTSFFNLLTMITTSGDTIKIKNTPIKEIKDMIDSFTIAEERFVDNEYIASLETTFNKKKVLKFLERKNIFPSMPLKNKVLLIPILLDTETESIYLFDKNVFYNRWNNKKNNFQLIEYLLPSEDLDDLNKIQNVMNNIEGHDFTNLITKYDLKDHIILIIYKNKSEIKILSKINLNNSVKIDNQKYSKINLQNETEVERLIADLKNSYEDQWKKKNEINTSIKLPMTISINSKDYKKITEVKDALENIDLISEFYTLKFDSQNIQFKVIYNGSPRLFLNDMSKKNLDLIKSDNAWTIK
ncbi:hypothetical protein N8824_01090 [Candidatus Pelagibacter sp.]|nr:hypothetical protein [Candidatus Pelagibacter sp.]